MALHSRFDLGQLHGRVVQINLSDHTIKELPITEEVFRDYLGGRGLNQYLLSEMSRAADHPLSPDNPVLISCGLLTGTVAPGAVRINLDSKSLFSGGVGSSSAGGEFGAWMKQSGFGTLVISGASDTPCFVELHDGEAFLRDASHIWGETTSRCAEILEGQYPSPVRVLCIGPAAEKGVLGGCVIVDRSRAAAKCGIGTILGAKRLKAVVAMGGHAEPRLADPRAYDELSRKLWRKVVSSPVHDIMCSHGTLCGVNTKNPSGAAPFRHYQDGYMDAERIARINETGFKRFEVRRFPTRGCPITCRATYAVPDGLYAGTRVDAIEANSVQNFGIKLDIDNPAAILNAHMLCNDYGMDIDTVAESIAWAFECFQEGIINASDTDGLDLVWGNHPVLPVLIRMIASRTGIGECLSQGSKKAAKQWGARAEALTATMKGQDLYEAVQVPRGYGLGACLATRGGGHCSGSPFCEFNPQIVTEDVGEAVYGTPTAGDPTSYRAKGKLVALHERLHSVVNSLGICGFMTIWQRFDLLDMDDLAALVSRATGRRHEKEDLEETGQRIHTLERLYNYTHAGMDGAQDLPPERFFHGRVLRGPYAGLGLDREEFALMLAENYETHGWSRGGVPTRATLDALRVSARLGEGTTS
jgi:aldehyde:ferredoxin oxidoreductase